MWTRTVDGMAASLGDRLIGNPETHIVINRGAFEEHAVTCPILLVLVSLVSQLDKIEVC